MSAPLDMAGIQNHPVVSELAATLVLGSLLDEARKRWGAFELVDHWSQGEFHHDVVVRIINDTSGDLPGPILVIATNCNGGVKEVLSFAEIPNRLSLWSLRCPTKKDFNTAQPATPLARSFTVHWFDPCELLTDDARSELRPEHRIRQPGGGWTCRK